MRVTELILHRHIMANTEHIPPQYPGMNADPMM
jgi:hypothetical protein